MALTVTRWVVTFVLSGALLAAAALPSPADKYRYVARDEPAKSIRSLADLNLDEASRALVVLERRDAVLTIRRRATAAAMTFEGLPAPVQRAAAAAFDSVLAELQPRTHEVAVRAVLIFHSALNERLEGNPRVPGGVWHLTPSATDGRTCLALYFVDDYYVQGRRLVDAESWAAGPSRHFARRILGPCAFYSAYGLPGPHVERWLRRSNFLFVRAANWRASRPSTGRPRVDSADAKNLSAAELVSLMFQTDPTTNVGWTPIEWACARGDLITCRDVVFSSQFTRGPPLGPDYGVALSPFGYSERREKFWFLSDLAHEAGPERFTRFWQSPLPVDSAFAATIGMPIEEWTHRWLLERSGIRLFGPGVTVGAMVTGLLIVALAMGAAALAAVRRQVA